MALFRRKPKTLTAAIKTQNNQTTQLATKQSWQSEAWEFYDTVGELRYVAQYLSNALSRCKLIAVSVGENGEISKTTDAPIVSKIVQDIAGGVSGQASLLSTLATHLTIVGECWLAIITLNEDEPEEWHILSTDEVTRHPATGETVITLPDGNKYTLTPGDSIQRIWQPHARKAHQADSITRAALPILREITRLTQWIEATAKSRLVSNGVLAVPNEMSLPGYNEIDAIGGYDNPDGVQIPEWEQTHKGGAEQLTDALIETMAIAVKDPSSAAALTPIVIQAPGEMIAQIKHIKIGTEFTQEVGNLREAATKRLALALDVPAEILTGMSGANHWSAWQIEESAVRLHIEPLLTTICERLTKQILRPLLKNIPQTNPNSFAIWFDTQLLTQSPNRTTDANTAYQAGLITEETYLTELGFTASQQLDINTNEGKQELAKRLIMAQPNLIQALGSLLNIETTNTPPITATPNTQPTNTIEQRIPGRENNANT